MRYDTIEAAAADLKHGKLVVLCDEEDRENEGDLVCAGSMVTPEQINFMAKYGRGLICVPISAERAEKLNLPLVNPENRSMLSHCNFTISADARAGISTGSIIVNPKSGPNDLIRPGHLFPLIGKEGGVLVRTGHTEGSLDLLSIAGLPDVAVICEILDDEGNMLRGNNLIQFAKKHALTIVTIKNLIEYRRKREKLVYRAVESVLPTKFGDFTMIVYKTKIDEHEHIALIYGDIKNGESVLTRVHSECITSEVFNSSLCECKQQLNGAMSKIVKAGAGVIVYMRQEGRGIGLINKLKAYNIQASEGLDTVDANIKLGFKADLREYGIGAQILLDLGVKRMKLMTNNPTKVVGLAGYGITIDERVPIQVGPSERTQGYLNAKKKKMGHILDVV